jgi:hypothetical protein
MNGILQTPDGAAGTLLSASEKALEKITFDGTPLTTEVFKAISTNARHLPPLMLADGKAILFSAATVAAITFNSAVEICSDGVLTTLRDLQAKMEAVLKVELPKYSNMAVTPETQRRQGLIQEKVLAGETLGDAITPSREAIAQEFQNRRYALEGLLKKLTHEQLVPLAKPILEKFEKVVEDFMRCTEDADRAACAAFGLEYTPGVLWKAAAAIAVRYQTNKMLPGSHLWKTPKVLLEGIIEI